MTSSAHSDFSNLYITFPNEAEANKLARQLVEQRLANFVNVMPTLVTFYRETGQPTVQLDSETLVMAKIRTKDAGSIIEFVSDNHPYDIAELYSVPIANMSPHMQKNLEACLKSD